MKSENLKKSMVRLVFFITGQHTMLYFLNFWDFEHNFIANSQHMLTTTYEQRPPVNNDHCKTCISKISHK